ncbi:MAG: PKD domain-containing protein [Bacteroidota bacterium]
MKQTLRFLFIAFSLLLQAQLFANTVIVKGTVKDSANHPIANKTVKIYSTDSTQGCALSHTVITNPNGYYIDTLTCSGNISKLIIIVENCNGTKITHDPIVGLNGVVESNFIICTTTSTPPPVSCKAAFSFSSTATGVSFKSANTSTLAPGDSIIARTWKFGDETSLGGNQADIIHAYAKPGVYNVCLTIKTKKGCESSSCQTVVFTPSSNDCKIEAVVTVEKLAPRKFRFNSSHTTILLGDSIFQRIWKFSDGTSLDGNQVNPLKEFKDTGVYTACVSIRTMKGCEKTFCITIIVHDSVPGTTPPPTGCKAEFSTTIHGLTVKFNSAHADPGAGDSIISRTWIFGDTSAQLTGNRIDPSHLYAKAGSYTACLVIKTKKGCESRYCFELKLHDSVATIPTGCKATFTYTIKDSVITFNSSASTGTSPDDSIISRTWYYIDGTTNVSLGGNVISPSYSIANIKPGIYSVKLVIKTKKGCESKFEGKVTIPSPAPPTGCKAVFTYTIKDSVITFNSSASVGTSPDDSIIIRTWHYFDNTTNVSLGGNVISPSYPLANIKPGTYNVYLVIKTKKGCESKFTATVTITAPIPTGCKAVFSYANMQNGTVKFNSSASKASSSQDSIISRTWIFGDNSVPVQGNIDPSHTYTKEGKYTVLFYIKTKSGCESKYSDTITIRFAPPVNCNVEVQFTAERISLKKVQFNSSLSKTHPGDSIVQRNWKFGDNTTLGGNEIKPVKEYPFIGIYTACLEVKTAKGCVAQVCKQVIVQDSVTTPQASVDYLKIMSINPNPVITMMVTTIFSRNSNVEAEISVYDIYGVRKMTVKKLLSQGNNNIEMNLGNLYRGPYFLRVTSRSGNDSKTFYKL